MVHDHRNILLSWAKCRISSEKLFFRIERKCRHWTGTTYYNKLSGKKRVSTLHFFILLYLKKIRNVVKINVWNVKKKYFALKSPIPSPNFSFRFLVLLIPLFLLNLRSFKSTVWHRRKYWCTWLGWRTSATLRWRMMILI